MVLSVTKCQRLAEIQYCERIDEWCYHVVCCCETVDGQLTHTFCEWYLEDDVSSIKCIIIGDVPNTLNSKKIKLTPPNFNLIVEHFQGADDGSTAEAVYLIFEMQNVNFLEDLEVAMHLKSLNKREMKFSKSPLEKKKLKHLFSASVHTLFPSSARQRYANLKPKLNLSSYSQSDNLGQEESTYNGRVCQKFLLQHKLPLMSFPGKKSIIFVLVTFLGGFCTGKKMWLAIQDGCANLTSALNVGRMYCLKLPPGVAESIFFKKDTKMFLLKFLPEVYTVYLPEDCIIFEINSFPHVIKQVCECSDIYSVSKVINELSIDDLCSVEGCLEVRKLDKSCRSYVTSTVHFGIPGNCDLFLELRDLNNNQAIRLILANWKFRLYPYGLLPQANIRVSHVQKKQGSSGQCYLHTTPLTSIELVSLKLSAEKQIYSNLWTMYSAPSSSVSPGSVISCVMDNYKLIKMTLQAMCTDCSYPSNRNGCMFIGCHSISKPTLMGKATVIMTNMIEKVVLHLAGENVRTLLGADETTWWSLTQVVLLQDFGNLTYEISHIKKPEALHERVFQGYCETLPMHRFHVRCRRMSSGVSAHKESLASFFCEAIKLPGKDTTICLYKVLDKN